MYVLWGIPFLAHNTYFMSVNTYYYQISPTVCCNSSDGQYWITLKASPFPQFFTCVQCAHLETSRAALSPSFPSHPIINNYQMPTPPHASQSYSFISRLLIPSRSGHVCPDYCNQPLMERFPMLFLSVPTHLGDKDEG